LAESTGSVQVDGAVVGSFSNYDGLVEQLRARASKVGLSFAMIDEIAGLARNRPITGIRVVNVPKIATI
jgi:hypothetical protein